MPALREAIAEHQRARYGLEHEDIQVTFGATEAITAALLGLCDPGDEVVALDPFYDSYRAGAALAGARLVGVPLRPPDWRFDPAELDAAVTDRTRVLLLNTPHNPTGRVLDRAELEAIARCASSTTSSPSPTRSTSTSCSTASTSRSPRCRGWASAR